MVNYLFQSYDLSSAMQLRFQQAAKELTLIPDGQFLSATPDELHNHLFEKLKLDPLTIYEDRIEEHLNKGLVTYNGQPAAPQLELVVKLPYSGLQQLWLMRPTMGTSAPPLAELGTQRDDGIGHVTLRAVVHINGSPEVLRQSIQRDLQTIRRLIANQALDITKFNDAISRHIKQAIETRLAEHAQFLAAAKKLKVPIAPIASAPLMPIVIEKRKIPELPPATMNPAALPEPGIPTPSTRTSSMRSAIRVDKSR
jgi:hypothetical protein